MKQVSFTLRKRENGKWQGIIRQKQGKVWRQVESKGGFKKKALAQNWANSRIDFWQTKTVSEYDNMSIGELKKIYLNYLSVTNRISTLRNAKSALIHSDKFNDLNVYDVNKSTFYNFCMTSNQNAIKYLRIFFNFVINELDVRISNPVTKRKFKQKENKALTENEFKKLISYLRDDYKILACKIGFYAGLRISEVAGLTYDCIKPDKLIINKQWDNRYNDFREPKSENGYREIPIKPFLYKEIQEYKTKNLNFNQKLFIQKSLQHMVQKHMRDCLGGTEFEGITFHSFRKSFISKLIQNGLDVKTTSYLAGDKVETILKVYVSVNSDTKEIAKKFIMNL